ncbi:MAG TPA: hypothetical protein VED00_03070 [archaeon]|nr:hypothetical protein [archaeon]
MSDGLETKNKSKNKMTAIAVIVIIVIAVVGVAAWQLSIKKSATKQTTQTASFIVPPTNNLTIIGANGNELFLNQTSMEKLLDKGNLTSYTGYGGLESSGGVMESYGSYTGVPVLNLLKLVGGISSGETLTITCTDGYSMVYTYQQVYGTGYVAYNNVTGSQVNATAPFNLVLAYYYNGTAFSSDVGPLRIVLLGTGSSGGLLTEGHFWCKLVDTIEVTGSIENWQFVFQGTTTNLTTPMAAYLADFNHFPQTYTDKTGNVWKGVALYQLIYDNIVNGGSSNASLANGYTIKVIGTNGYVVFTSTEINSNPDSIIVASELNGAVLPSPYWPITLVGSGVSSTQMIEGIYLFQIIPNPT